MKEIGITDEEQALITEMSNISNKLVPLEDAAQADMLKNLIGEFRLRNDV